MGKHTLSARVVKKQAENSLCLIRSEEARQPGEEEVKVGRRLGALL